MIIAIWWGGVAAASLLLGYLLASRGISNRWLGIVMGLGAGALISAIAYELIPDSAMGGPAMAAAFLGGALTFFAGDWIVDRIGGGARKAIDGKQASGSGAAIFVGTLLDNIPESMILGIGLAFGGAINAAFLAAVFISNLPEGVAGTVNLQAAGYSRRRIIWMWGVLVIVSALCAGLGYLVIGWTPAATGRYIQAFAAGAMLIMLADAMMPEAFEHGGKVAGLFTVLGFLLSATLSVAQ